MSILHKYLDMLARASVKHRSLRVKVVAVILGFSTFFIIIPFVLFFAANMVEGLFRRIEWRHWKLLFARGHLCRAADPGVVNTYSSEDRQRHAGFRLFRLKS